jgi:hypothetical protein
MTIFLTGCEEVVIDCKGNENVAGICIDTTNPSLVIPGDLEVPVGTKVDLLDGVEAIDDLDGDITNSIVVDSKMNKNLAGTYFISYTVKDEAGNEAIAVRYISFYKEYELGENLVYNGNFTEGDTGYNTYQQQDDGHGNIYVEDGVMVIEVLSIDQSAWYKPRVDFSGIPLEKDKSYRISFRAKADTPRFIMHQVGELINYEPWFDDFNSSANKVFSVTTEYQTFEYEFTMYEDSNSNGCLLFEFGSINGQNILTTIYLDSIEVKEIK